MSLGDWSRPGAGILYGCTMVKGLLLLFIDNSNYQVDDDQLEFTRLQVESVSKDTPIVILLHIPLMLPGATVAAKELCGHAQWGAATDTVAWSPLCKHVTACAFVHEHMCTSDYLSCGKWRAGQDGRLATCKALLTSGTCCRRRLPQQVPW